LIRVKMGKVIAVRRFEKFLAKRIIFFSVLRTKKERKGLSPTLFF